MKEETFAKIFLFSRVVQKVLFLSYNSDSSWTIDFYLAKRDTFKIHPRSKSTRVQNPPDQNPPNQNPPDQKSTRSKSTKFKIHPVQNPPDWNQPESKSTWSKSTRFKIHPSQNLPDQNQPEFFFFRKKNWFLMNFVILKKVICLKNCRYKNKVNI